MPGEVVSLDERRVRPLHMMTREQRDEALAALARARKERDRTIAGAYQTFGDLVRAYEEAGIPVTDIAVAAGLTRQRIYQIRDEK